MLIPFGVFSAAGAGGGAAAGAYELISTAYGTGSSGIITFSSLPAGYKHLQIRAAARNDYATDNQQFRINFNNDTGSNYSMHALFGNGSTVTSSGNASIPYAIAGISAGSSSTASSAGASICDILDPFATTKFKTIRTIFGQNGSNSSIYLRSGLWQSTSAVTSITLTNPTGNFTTASRFSLYGIK